MAVEGREQDPNADRGGQAVPVLRGIFLDRTYHGSGLEQGSAGFAQHQDLPCAWAAPDWSES